MTLGSNLIGPWIARAAGIACAAAGVWLLVSQPQ
jgi:hydrogenase/urease accessory protein HupE